MTVNRCNIAFIQFKNDIREILADYDSSKEEKYLQILGALKEYEKMKASLLVETSSIKNKEATF